MRLLKVFPAVAYREMIITKKKSEKKWKQNFSNETQSAYWLYMYAHSHSIGFSVLQIILIRSMGTELQMHNKNSWHFV